LICVYNWEDRGKNIAHALEYHIWSFHLHDILKSALLLGVSDRLHYEKLCRSFGEKLTVCGRERSGGSDAVDKYH
jgi:hypothetical protein